MKQTWIVFSALAVMTACASVLIAAEMTETANLTPAELEAMGFDSVPYVETTTAVVPKGSGSVVAASLIVQEGDVPPPAPGAVSSLNAPFTDGNGAVGFTGSADENFVWYDTGITWLSSDGLPSVLTGAEGTMGVSNTGGFIYSPATDGDDSVWTHNGLLLAENTAAPGYSPPTMNTFNSRPTMLPSGASYWVAGVSYSGGTSSEGRVLYTSSDSTPGTITPVLASDDLVGGLPIDRPSGIGFDYQISDSGSHHIHDLLLDSGSTADDGVVYVDGAVIAREAWPSGSGDNWDNFDGMTINNDGNFLFSGDTDGATATDEFIAYNGVIAIREGDIIGGIPLTSPASVNTLSINNLGHAAFIWNHSGGEALFFACDASDLATATMSILSTGDALDFDGGGPDATVSDFNASSVTGPGLWLAEDGRVFVELDIDFGNGDVEAIVGLDLPSCGSARDLVINEIDYDQGSTDTEEFIEIHNPTPAPISLDGYTLELVNGTGGGASIYQTIDLPAVTLMAGEYYVVCGNAVLVPNCDFDVDPDTNLIQNGSPDAVGLRAPSGALADTVSYEGDTGAPYTEGTGVGLEDDPGIDYYSISRFPDGIDTDVNNVDLSGRCNSPGLPNFDTTSNCNPVPVELMSFSIE